MRGDHPPFPFRVRAAILTPSGRRPRMSTTTELRIPGVDAAHPDGQYTTVAKWFHWLTVGLMAIALPMGFVIKHIRDADKMFFYQVHESAGLLILVVALARLLWRWRHPAPPLPPEIPGAMRAASAAVHHALYALLILQPLLGFFMTNAFGFPMAGATAFLGVIDFPKFMEPVEWLANLLKLLHTIGGWSILVLLVLHIGGAVMHHAVRRDGTLMRML
jgi:cytochrome b561